MQNRYRVIKKLLIFLAGIMFPLLATAQLETEGTPALWNFQSQQPISVIQLHVAPVPKQAAKPDREKPQPLFAGYITPFHSSLLQKGVWQQLPNGTYVWTLTITLPQTKAINLYLGQVRFRQGDKFFIYTSDHRQLLGAFGSQNNGRAMGTAYINSNQVTLELDTRQKYDTLPFRITGVGNIVNPGDKTLKDFGDAGSCEIPVNCPEGNNYKKQKNGVARILLREGSDLYWCTGSLINDTQNDGTPYFLTANHCGAQASTSDYDQWVFYFNYESPDCSRPSQQPVIHALSGAKLLASASYYIGSDFKLLLLKNKVPFDYKPYFNGWDRSGKISDSGVVIHHPEGDIKMISTYKTPIRPVDYYGTVTDPNANFWEVKWATTISGHGVTEGGSSGSPLFNSAGLIIGTLTGGDASCSSPDAPDYFGRFSKHWYGTETDSTRQLAYWLDKQNTDVVTLPGFDPLSTAALAKFSSDVKKTPVGGTIRFTNLSTGPITSYRWYFEGGDPEVYNDKTPPPVHYSKMGTFQVKLTVTSATGNENTQIDSVFVLPAVYPNPAKDGHIHILLGSYHPEDISVSVFDMLGRKLDTFKPQFGTDNVIVQLPHNQNGLYIIRLQNKDKVNIFKVINYHP